MTGFLFQLCAIHRCSVALFNEYRHLTPVHQRPLVARASAARLRRRRANNRAPATHFPLSKRRKILGFHSLRSQRLFERRLDMSSHQEIRRRSSVAERAPTNSFIAAAGPSTQSTYAPARDPSGARQDNPSQGRKEGAIADTMAPPPSRTEEPSLKRHSRSQSTASRHVNRLSLTLPIAPPTSDPSRPTPTSTTTMSSVPPTPIDSGITSPVDASEFIVAIAAQERRVLELREELSRAEADLTHLKRQWSSTEVTNKRGELRRAESFRSPVPTSDDESIASRRSVDMDRRKMLLQKEKETSTAQNRRRVIRGGHTRTLSLLSPAKSDEGFSLHEDLLHEPVKLPPLERRTAQLINPNLSKRASWQPRTQQSMNVAGVPQIVEDFKLGLRAFVEDIRQITVGDEPIGGQVPTRSTAIDYRNNGSRGSPSNQDTIRASHANRPKVSTVFDSPSTAGSNPTPASNTDEAPKEKEKAKPGKNKHFSWTPLGFDSLDDNDWSNWESPTSVKTSRWSGSTIGSGGIDDMEHASDDGEQNTTPSKRKSLLGDAKLGEILPNMVNQLSPSNIKRTATNLMDEWEKSLAEPQGRGIDLNKENSV
ncbi:Fc.00g050770.m01.CDS01 [Cosmosporella sp. VM-42]